MPAVQVRDFPQPLYEELKSYASQRHRSIAQQVIIAVERMLDQPQADPRLDAEGCLSGAPLGRVPLTDSSLITTESADARKASRRRRKEAFANFDALQWRAPELAADDIVAMVREGREERSDRIIAQALDPFADCDGEGVAE
ncbi:argininosuccinate lyase [uncultured Adlercreutzia sp.]|uniref:argininosuccinate lyase n=1 Tax=uncultured Adlercreutzia sp. TaxID=875803 RepID=UPI0026F3946E|nr:argininosuccinate lyase [uncultured Adlercreutzia sp.]